MLSLKLVTDYTAPGSGKLSVTALKSHLRVDSSADDSLIPIYIRAAIQFVQQRTGRAILPTTWRQAWDNFPSGADQLYLLRAPLRSLTSLTYVNDAGETVTVDTSDYLVDSYGEPPTISPAAGDIWPAYCVPFRRGVVVANYTAGYDDADAVPACLVHAIYLLVGHWYENREAVSDLTLKPVPMAVESLLEMERIHWFDYEGDHRWYGQ